MRKLPPMDEPAGKPDGVGRSAQFAMLAVIIVLLGTCAMLFQSYRAATPRQRELEAREHAERLRYARALDAIAEIQDSLNGIAAVELPLPSAHRPSAFSEQRTGESSRTALSRIAEIGSLVQRSKHRIAQLEATLNRSTFEFAAVKRLLESAKRSASQKELLVRQLRARVRSLDTRVDGLESEVERRHAIIQARDQTIEEKRRELGTIYFVMGTKRALRAQGLIVAKGGVLGVGKTMQPSSIADDRLFTMLDTDRESTLTVPSPKARVLSAQPASSYSLLAEGDNMVLHIRNPRSFREVRQLVIMTE